MPVTPATPQTIERAAGLLRGGGVVAFPTETVYGLGAHAFDAKAVSRIFEIKRRPSFDPVIVHVADEAMLARVVREISQRARTLIERFWPGPLTLVFKRSDAVPLLVTAGLETVAVRMPSHPVALALLRASGVPLAALLPFVIHSSTAVIPAPPGVTSVTGPTAPTFPHTCGCPPPPPCP